MSDLICLEHQLSVIEIKPYRERQKRTLYPPKESNRDRLCGVIDTILAEKPKDYEVFLQGLEPVSYTHLYTNAILLCKNACWAVPKPHLFCIVPMQAARFFKTLLFI